jgi:hypothetical protein
VLSPLTPTAVPASACDAVRYMICKIGPERPDEKEFAAAAAGHSVFLPSRTQLGPHRITQAICCVVVVGDGGVDSLIRERFGGVASTHADKHTHTHHPCSLSPTHTHT